MYVGLELGILQNHTQACLVYDVLFVYQTFGH